MPSSLPGIFGRSIHCRTFKSSISSGGRSDCAPNFKRFRKQQFRPSQIVPTVKPKLTASGSDNGGALMRWIEENEPPPAPAQKTAARGSPRKPWR